MQVSIVGLDIANHVFQLHGVDAKGKIVLRKRLRRNQVLGPRVPVQREMEIERSPLASIPPFGRGFFKA